MPPLNAINAHMGTALLFFAVLMDPAGCKIWLGFAKAGEVSKLTGRHIAATLDED
jgi:hypothetical protein